MITPYHAKYFAHKLTLQGGQGVDKLSQSLMSASVDLNPHQVDGALFALRSPFSKGVILADEVGLGKTIEAGLVLCQYWAEQRKHILIIAPASLRKQWQMELEDKFALDSTILDAKSHGEAARSGRLNPFSQKRILITSYQYASRMAEELKSVPWDLVVFDEAHKLRNSYRENNKMGQRLRWALEDAKKLLLTATPFQNSLSELYGLCSLVDDKIFGDYPTFRTLYVNGEGNTQDLKNRLKPFCNRTLRKDVLEFVRYTERKVETIAFKPTDEEHRLYLAITSFLQRTETYAIPEKQKHLTAVVLRKMLASSPVALAGTLTKILDRLEQMKSATHLHEVAPLDFEDEDLDEDLLEEFEDEEEGDEVEEIDLEKLNAEIDELRNYRDWARNIGMDTKSKHLLSALELGYAHMDKLGAKRKAVIFTESRKTQAYLKNYLENNGHAGKVVCFAGGAADAETQKLFEIWKQRYPEKVTGSLQIDRRQAIVDHFRDDGEILLATEAAGEGINLQFCALLINYDLPWNPQRVEQRIGRVHRYGQQHDVVVVNFLNSRNQTDQRVYELLRHKFHLFEGVLGASDEVLGSLQSGPGFEARITEILLQCRTTAEIDARFDALQKELEKEIEEKKRDTRNQVLEHFDEDVHALLKIDYEDALRQLDRVNREFWHLTEYSLQGKAEFCEDDLSFELRQSPVAEAPCGTYWLNRKQDTRKGKETLPKATQPEHARLYRLSHPLAEYCVQHGKACTTPEAALVFDLSAYGQKVSALEPLKGQSGILLLQKVVIESVEREEFLLFSARLAGGATLSQDVAERLFRLPARSEARWQVAESTLESLRYDATLHRESVVKRSLDENNRFFQEKREELYRWAEDVVSAAERELKQVKTELRNAEREAREAVTLEDQKRAQENIRKLEQKKRKARQAIFDVEDQIEGKRDAYITRLEGKLTQNVSHDVLFSLHWKVI